MTGELRGLRVLVPRGGATGARLARLVRERGGEPVVVPLTVTAPAPDAAALRAAIARLANGCYDWLVITSATGAEVLAKTLAGSSSMGSAAPKLPSGTRVAAVGPVTAQALAERGIAVHLVPSSDHSGRGLALALSRRLGAPRPDAPARPEQQRVLLLLSELAGTHLEQAIVATGHRAERITAYRTVPAPHDPAFATPSVVGRVDAILVLSASGAAQTAQRLAPLPPGTLLAAIGPPTARALAAHGLRAAVTAGRHTVPGLLDALAAHLLRLGTARAPGDPAPPRLPAPLRRHSESESS